jgi:selenocysteine-specific elongation factor
MKHIIIGTAGHIDHGKTALIKAITNRDTDTLKEEKERGISINLGFTYFDLPSKKRAGIIDVPGHERFIKNMLAGASSIDLVLFVIAADEGIMPQTREHYDILSLLNVKNGIIVITKIDMVEAEWLHMVKDEIGEFFKDSVFKDAPVMEVSSKTKQGIPELINVIDRMSDLVEEKDVNRDFYLPIDRVFTVTGFGTVVTGTIISGQVKINEELELYTSNIITKARGIQVHEEDKETAYAGQRCAINLANVKVENIERGDVLSIKGSLKNSFIIDCRLNYLSSNRNPLKNNQRVRLYHGTSEILCKIRLFNKEELKSGNSDIVQLVLEKSIASRKGDRFVIRNCSPMITIGGGYIIEPNGIKIRRNSNDYIEELKTKDSGDSIDILENYIKKNSRDNLIISDIEKGIGLKADVLLPKINELLKRKRIFNLADKFYHANYLKEKQEELENYLSAYHENNPLSPGLSKEEIRSRLFKNCSKKEADNIFNIFQKQKIINIKGSFISLFSFAIKYSKEQMAIKDDILSSFSGKEYTSLNTNEYHGKYKEREFNMVLSNLFREEYLVRLPEDVIILKESYNKAKDIAIDYLKKNGKLTPTDFRAMLGTNRKAAVGILMKLDEEKITKRIDDGRVLI